MQELSLKNKIVEDNLNRLSDEIEKFDDFFRITICSKCKNHKKEHHNVVEYPSGKVFCDELRIKRKKRFKKRIIEHLNSVSTFFPITLENY